MGCSAGTCGWLLVQAVRVRVEGVSSRGNTLAEVGRAEPNLHSPWPSNPVRCGAGLPGSSNPSLKLTPGHGLGRRGTGVCPASCGLRGVGVEPGAA